MNLDEIFSKAQELPSIPKVVQELIQSFQNDDFDMDDIAKKISLDQVLSAKVLRLANSARYGGNREIGSINEAVVRLGFDALRTLVLASGFVSTFKAPEGFDLKSFWRESFTVAEVSRWFAQQVGQDQGTAFTCGMISNIGDLMVNILLHEKAQEIARVVSNGGDKALLDYDAWGFTSEDVGAKVAQMWKFPPSVIDAIAQQGAPLDQESPSQLACYLYLARYVKEARLAEKPLPDIIKEFPNDVAQAAGLNLAEVLDQLDAAVNIESDVEALLD